MLCSKLVNMFRTDIDECDVDNGECEHLCNNIDGSYYCSCHHGYQLLENDTFNCTGMSVAIKWFNFHYKIM